MKKALSFFLLAVFLVSLLNANQNSNTENKPIVVVISSYNNSQWCHKNLSSVLSQDYTNFRIIYIDDASDDGMSDQVKEFLLLQEKAHLVTYIRSEKVCGGLANLYSAIQRCQNNEIVVVLDGDDWLAHDQVLSKINEVYADPDVWLSYGNYALYPSGKQTDGQLGPIPDKVIKKNLLREYPRELFHLKTFYASLFKQIALHDLLKDGKFYTPASDLAIMLPLIEMAGGHAKFVKDVLLIYNPDKVESENLKNLNHYIRTLPRYSRLAFFPKEKENQEKADLVVFSFDRPMQLYAFLESLHKYVSGLDQKTVVYRSSSDTYESAYEQVKNAFPSVQFVREGNHAKNDFRELTMRAIFESPSPYIVFAVDDIIFKDTIDLTECTKALEKTSAYGFFLKLGKGVDYCYTMNQYQGIPESIECPDNVYAWQFEVGKCDWKYPNTLDFTVYKKEEIRNRLEKLDFRNPNTFESLWAKKADTRKVGLYFADSKLINIPLNMVNLSDNRCMNSYSAEELLNKFKAGLKIDIAKFHQIANRSVHTESEIVFIKHECEH